VLSLEYDSTSQYLSIEACVPLPQDTKPVDLAAAYLSLCDSDSSSLSSFFASDSDTPLDPLDQCPTQSCPCAPVYTILDARMLLAIFVGKKYKPVALKVCPIETELPSQFRIVRNIKGDPLKDIPLLPTHPPPYQPMGRYTEERKDVIDQVHPGDFLLPTERALMHSFMSIQNAAFAWCDPERGHFREDFFPPIDIPTIPHKPWAECNIPIPPGIYEEVCRLIKIKLDAGVYEPSNSSYHLHWFCVVKKDGKSLHIVHSLEPLNRVTIKHAGVTPFTDQIGEHFTGCTCGGMLDLYVGYDERGLAESSHDLTTFQSPFGAL
jgi:hypothetical protein